MTSTVAPTAPGAVASIVTQNINGFYTVSKTASNTLTFFVQSAMPAGVQPGWVINDVPGITGRTRVSHVTPYQGSYPGQGGFNGAIDFQVNVPQTIQGVQTVAQATVNPAPVIVPPPPPTLTGVYFTQRGEVVFYSGAPLPRDVTLGWNIKNLPGIPPQMVLNVASVSFQSGNLGAIPYKGILTAFPLPTPLQTPSDPSAFSKFKSLLSKLGNFGEVLRGKIPGLGKRPMAEPAKLGALLASSPNLLNFFSQKTNLDPQAILSDPKQLSSALSELPELANAIGQRIVTGPNKVLDGFLNDVNVLGALQNGNVLPPSLPSTDDYPLGYPVRAQGALVDPTLSTAFVAQPVTAQMPVIRAPIEDSDFVRRPVPLRDLDDIEPDPPFPLDKNFTEKRNLGFNAGGVLSLDAIGPQEEYIANVSSFHESQWSPEYPQYTNAVTYQQYFPVVQNFSNTFIQPAVSGIATVELRPSEQGDLFSNMHLQVSLPALPSGNSYTNQIGRALIQQVDFIINETVIETIYDDWLVIKDQTFLDYDEQIGMFNQVNGGQANQNLSPSAPLPLLIPLEFFFCRRHSHENKKRERLRRPFFPVCALWAGQRLYVRFTFRPQYWFTNYPGPIDLIKPLLVVESVLLTPQERIYYRNTPLRYIVPIVKKESTTQYQQGTVNMNLTANFPVQLLVWFIRNKAYESTSPAYFDVRYLYGYATQYISTAVPLTFPSGSAQYLDAIETVKVTVNNVDILDTFANGPYTSFLQPMQHGLSVPQKNIYMYSFGLNITEYNQGGYLNFSKLNSQTSNLTITFLPAYRNAIADYSLYLFYYGYSILEFNGGFAAVSYL